MILMSLLGLALTWVHVRKFKEIQAHATLALFAILWLGALVFSAHGISPTHCDLSPSAKHTCRSHS